MALIRGGIMHTVSTQGYHRFSLFCALTGFVGCSLFSMFYYYKERELAGILKEQAEEIKQMERQCAIQTSSLPRRLACNLAADQHIRFHRNHLAKQAYRKKANVFLILSFAMPLLILAIVRWWYWVVTGRFRSRNR